MRRKLIYIAVFALVAALHNSGALDFLEARLSDLRFSVITSEPTDELVVVAIDPPSLVSLDVWPWPRRYHAEVLNRLIDAGARQVAFDVDFSATTNPENDLAFEQAAARAGDRLILAIFKQYVPTEEGMALMTSRPVERFSRLARLASINVVPDGDGTVRHMPIAAYSNGHLVTSLAATLHGEPSEPGRDELIDFGIEISGIPLVSYADVLAGRADPDIFRGKSVLIGATAAQLHDQIPVPRYVSISGALLHALAYQSLENGRVLKSQRLPITMMFGALFILLFGDKMHLWSWRQCLTAVAVGPSALFGVSLITQAFMPWSIEVAPSMILIAVILSAATMDQVYAQRIALLFQGRRAAQSRSIMDSVVENSFDGIATFDPNGALKSANNAFLDMFGLGFEAAQGSHLDSFVKNGPGGGAGPGGIGDSTGGQESEAEAHPFGQAEGIGKRADGSEFPIDFSISRAIAEDYSGIVITVRDTTERVRRQQELEYQAQHDSLTGMPNRVLLDRRLEQAVESCRHSGGQFALLVLDLDRFKEINDTLGHKIGDIVLVEVAARLAEPLSESHTIARLGGDEFAIVLPNVPDRDYARHVTQKLVESLLRPVKVSGLDLEVGVSIGIAIFPDHAQEANKLFQCADIAMYQAKQSLSSAEFYDEVADRNSLRHLTMSGELRMAIERDELKMAYQPQIDLASRRVTGLEALMRWTHYEMGPIPPDEFVTQAERTGLIQSLTFWSIETALLDLAKIRASNDEIDIAINLSARMLHDQTLFNFIQHQLARWNLPASAVTLEITESALMANPETAMDLLRQMSAMGLQFSIDDFGTGYSSLAYLKRLSVHELKIDKSFVLNMIEDSADAAIVRSTVDLAHHLGLRVVAEGIESEGHIDLLRALDCDIGQGFHIAKPMNMQDLSAWLERIQDQQESGVANLFPAPAAGPSLRRFS